MAFKKKRKKESFRSLGKSKATKFLNSFFVVIVVSDGRPHRAHVLSVLILICSSVVVEGIVEKCNLSVYAMTREKTSNFHSTWPAVCRIHKYGVGSQGGEQAGLSLGKQPETPAKD